MERVSSNARQVRESIVNDVEAWDGRNQLEFKRLSRNLQDCGHKRTISKARKYCFIVGL